MQQIVRHKLVYTADKVALTELIDSLQAQERLLQEGVVVLARAAPDSDLRLITIQVNSIASGSLLVDLSLELYHAYQTSIDDEVIKGIEGLTGLEIPAQYESLVSLAAIGVAFYIARWAYKRVANNKDRSHQRPVHIETTYNQVVTVIAERLQLDSAAVDRAFASELTPKKERQLLGRVTDFLRPAKQDPGSEIEVAGFGTITSETIAEYPSDADLVGLEDTTVLDLPGARIEIRATDRDSLRTGWKAKILDNDDFPSKLPMDLYPTVDAEKLADHKVVTADLSIEFARESGGTLRPKRIHLLRFDSEAA